MREFTTSRKADELVAALDVTKRTESDSTSGTRGRGIDKCVFLMDLCVCSEGETTVRLIVYYHTSENGTLTKRCRYAINIRGKVQQEDCEIDKFDLDTGRYVLEKQCMPNSSETLLDNANDTSDTRDVLISGGGVEVDTETFTEFTKIFEFAIDWKVVDGESLGAVDRIHFLQCLLKVKLLT